MIASLAISDSITSAVTTITLVHTRGLINAGSTRLDLMTYSPRYANITMIWITTLTRKFNHNRKKRFDAPVPNNAAARRRAHASLSDISSRHGNAPFRARGCAPNIICVSHVSLAVKSDQRRMILQWQGLCLVCLVSSDRWSRPP